ncbi:MAG: hypothetical protein LQ337_006223 [Flavoplaca oasis]|nr:MAG: hypothetical protein LQ337_006223 [Flavoplaca oasis]
MARRHGGGRGGHDDGRPVYIDDGHGGYILDLSVPRLAGEPRPGPWHQIMFEAMGGPHRCKQPEQGCHTGGGCEATLRQALLAQAVSEGYQGPPDPRQVREFTMPRYDEIVEGFLEWAKPDRVILPGGAEPLGGPGFRRTIGMGRHGNEGGRHGRGGGAGGHGSIGGGGGARKHGHPTRQGGGEGGYGPRGRHGGGGGHGPGSRHGGGGRQHGMSERTW